MIRRFFASAGGRWAPFVFAVSLVAVVAAGVWYTGYTQRQSEQKWCAVVSTLDDAYSSRPASTALGRDIAVKMAELRRDLGC